MSSKKKSKINLHESGSPSHPVTSSNNAPISLQPQSSYSHASQSGQQRSVPYNKAARPDKPNMRHQNYERSTPVTHLKPGFSMRRILRSRALQTCAVIAIALLPSLYFYNASKQASENAASPDTSNLQTTAEVVKRVNRHILLPSGEQPTVATVSDASKVRGQNFFANAASGDKVLVYAQAKKAYLYRPSIDRIIEVAPLAPNKTSPE